MRHHVQATLPRVMQFSAHWCTTGAVVLVRCQVDFDWYLLSPLLPFWGRFLRKWPVFSLPLDGGELERGWVEARSHAVFFPLPLAPSRLGEGGEKKPTLERGGEGRGLACPSALGLPRRGRVARFGLEPAPWEGLGVLVGVSLGGSQGTCLRLVGGRYRLRRTPCPLGRGHGPSVGKINRACVEMMEKAQLARWVARKPA